MSALTLAAFTSSCEGTGENGSGNGPETVGGTFVAEGISATYKYATHGFAVYNDDGKDIGVHLVQFSNIPSDLNENPTLKEGERFERFGFYLYTEADQTELESCELKNFRNPYDSPDLNQLSLPIIEGPFVECREGIPHPDDWKTIYRLNFTDNSTGNLKITRDGDNYKITGEFDLEYYSDSDENIMKKSTFSYYGPIKTVPLEF